MKNVLDYLENSAKKHPEKTAFEDPSRAVSYAALKEAAASVGTALAKRVDPGMPVPVFMDKSVDAIEAFLGAVYAGCFYTQIDVRQPESRIRQILDRLAASLVVTDRTHHEMLSSLSLDLPIVLIEDLRSEKADPACLSAIRKGRIDVDPLYCNFTSGSTGVPKGVLVSHRSVIDFIDCFVDLFDIREDDVIGNQAPFDFDVSVKDIYSTLKTGATMQIIPTRLFSIPTELLDLLVEKKVTTLIWAVSAMCILSQLHGFDYKVPHDVNKVIFSGEIMPTKQLAIWQDALPAVRFVNVYGPTEITCNCSYFVVDRKYAPEEVLPMGRAFPNERVFLLDEDDREIKDAHVIGELCVSGTALALGYYRDPEATKAAFVQHPGNHTHLETIYRTGDLAYYNEDGDLCFHARKDFQIKHMGHRIELGEIETALHAVPEVSRACCLFLKNKIIAHYAGEIDKKALASKLRLTLPPFMIPNRFVQHEQLPLNKNGKIDRQALSGGA